MKPKGRKTTRTRSGASLAENLIRTLASAELIAPAQAAKPLREYPGADAIDLLMCQRMATIGPKGRRTLDPLPALPPDFAAKVLRAVNDFDADFFAQMAQAMAAYSVRKDGTCQAAEPGKSALLVFAMGGFRPAPDTSKMGPTEILEAVEAKNHWCGQRPDLRTLRTWLEDLGINYKRGVAPR